MRAVVQRVAASKVTVDGEVVGEIGKGLNVLLGVGQEDGEEDIQYVCNKILHLRIFEDEEGKMNRSLLDIGGDLLVVSQFTLFGDCRKGKRPSFDKAAGPKKAEDDYNQFVELCRQYPIRVETGVFRAMMTVDIVNDGPVTLLIDSKRDF